MRGRRPKTIVLKVEEQEVLQHHLRTGKTEWRVARRARILLDVASGSNPCEVARAVGCDESTVIRVRDRYEERGVDAIFDAPRSGRPPEFSPPHESSNRQTGLCRSRSRRSAAHTMERAHTG